MNIEGIKERLKPGLFTTGDTKKDCLNLFGKLIRTKDIECLQEEEGAERKPGKGRLRKCLTTLDLTSLGVGSCVATGMYLVAGMVAKNFAGPGVVISFIIAALASLFSGACYAEFGVRVPKTTGSAYMYSYVTVGEGVAFVIGWNMVLEYLIGTAACASALSACFNTISGGAITDALKSYLGTIIGTDRPPDVIAFAITLGMMLVIAAGVKKSLVFNNILNVLNLAAWVFMMGAGLFYVDTNNWTQHKGFLPMGWSGVFSGAATCFYAFIGFDIIATTGEEANNPKKSIPLAIVSSLIIILIAYVSSSLMLTLIIPYDEISAESGLVAMFGQVGANRCKCIVAAGGVAGLTVSMFGSMFPMPRIVYAMAHDGLIFRPLAQVFPGTGTPVLATFICGSAAAVAAMIISLDVLVEMMSIGTLLAYTLVSTCVLILRYQPHTTNLMELLPESLRTPLKGSPTKEPPSIANGQAYQTGAHLRPDHLRTALEQQVHQPQRVMVRRVTRSSPDSDDTVTEEGDEGMRDDQFLVSDASEAKFYGTVHGGTTTGSVAGAAGPTLSHIARKIQAATYLCPAIFPWVDTGPATEESGLMVMKLVGLLYLLILLFDLTIVCGMDSDSVIVTLLVCTLLPAIIAVLLLISRKPQNRKTLVFMTPGLPFVPAIAVMVNIYLIFKLSILTLVRFTVWMTLGILVYFYYGIKHSSLEPNSQGGDGEAGDMEMSTAVPQDWASPQPPLRAPDPPPQVQPQSTGLFLPTGQFPTWDD
ncbi:probable cationic amino acid transporter [Cimex lectularius]|uniref:Cationic amino acid transporter C-terminal domain-containing protein n=1 Tax=Cimex lectularius TaxID=79782 RepID=A0A8I6S6Z2_CIMLE|nr:probable cationic amino acid transporter [Cimex lectularius]XP_014257027.1 probable cationic amino acid transporter [Cimex lectularius]